MFLIHSILDFQSAKHRFNPNLAPTNFKLIIIKLQPKHSTKPNSIKMNNMNLTRPLSFEISPQRITNIPEIGSSYKRYVGKSQSLPISLSPNHSQTFMSQHSSPCSSEVILTRGELCPCDDYEKYEKVCTEPDCKHQEQSCWKESIYIILI